MKIRHVHFTDEKQALGLEATVSAAIISITDPDRSLPDLSSTWGSILRLSFNDAEYDHALIRTFDRVADFREQHSDDPQPEHAVAIHRFIDTLPSKGIDTLVVHCRYGQSRSAAVAKYVIEECGATIQGGSLHDYNRTLYQLLKNPMTFETALQNMEQAELEASAQDSSSGLAGWLRASMRKWLGARN